MKVALYARVSSERQDIDLSISAQLKALREYAIKNSHFVVKEYVDEAESGRTSQRPAFREMIAAARRPNRPFDIILVWKYSRFARSREDSILFKAMLRKAGVQIISISEPFEDTPTGRLLEAMIESLDEFYSANLGEEVTRGMRESASRGFYVSSYAPYGYGKIKVKDGNRERYKLEVEPDQALVVERIFAEILGGQGLVEVAKLLNREGVIGPRGKNWGKTTIHKILTNEAYTGTLVWGRASNRNMLPIRVEDAWPPIIEHNTFERTQAILRKRAFITLHPKRVASNYLLSGIARCGHCGKALIGQEAKGGKFHYYTCGTLLKKGSGSCPAKYINRAKLERMIIDNIREQILTYENLKELVRLVNEEIDKASSDYHKRLRAVSVEADNVTRRLDRLYDALETGTLSLVDLAPRIQALRQHQEQLQTTRWELELLLSDRKVELADMHTITHYAEDLRNLLCHSSITEKKSFIKSFIREVVVTGKEVTIRYCLPVRCEQLTMRGTTVPPIVHDGGR
jgi:site-specific DNA recombinase